MASEIYKKSAVIFHRTFKVLITFQSPHSLPQILLYLVQLLRHLDYQMVPRVLGSILHLSQCGAFKNRAQAESLQGRLAMAGVNAQIATSEEWNRVRVGPFGSRDAATAAQDKARSVASCVVIGM